MANKFGVSDAFCEELIEDLSQGTSIGVIRSKMQKAGIPAYCIDQFIAEAVSLSRGGH